MQTERKEQCLHWKRKPFPELVRLAWPIVISLVSYSVMTVVDTLFVGRLGANALAAVGLGAMGVFTVLCFGLGVFAGAKVQVSQAVGARDERVQNEMLGAFLKLSALLGLGLCAAALLVAHAMPWISANAEVGVLSREYAAVRGFGILVALPAAAIGQFRQAVGDSRTAMHAALLANVVNLPLNALFIFGLEWGTLGAAVATTGSRVVELAALLIRQPDVSASWLCSSWGSALRAFRFGLPAGVERWLDTAAFAALVALLGRMGPAEVAAHQIALQILHFSFLPVIALGEAVSVLVAQAFGAGERALARRVVIFALRLSLVFSLACGMVFSGLARGLVRLFTDDALVLESGEGVLHVAALLQLLVAGYGVLKGALRGAGRLREVAWVTVVCAWVFTPPLTLLFGFGMGWGARGGWAALCVEVAVGLGVLSWMCWRSIFSERHDSSPVPLSAPAV